MDLSMKGNSIILRGDSCRVKNFRKNNGFRRAADSHLGASAEARVCAIPEDWE